MHWFHAQSVAEFHGTGGVIEKIRKIKEDRPEKGDPENKKTYKPPREWKDLVTDQTKVKLEVPIQGEGGIVTERVHVIRDDWGEVWPKKLLLSMAYKFDQYPKLQQLLIDTGDATIIYDISDDTFGAANLDGQIIGDNQVGQVLMRIREQLALRLEIGDESPLVKYPERKRPYQDTEQYDVILDELDAAAPSKVEEWDPEAQEEFAKWLEENGEKA
jgi:hypothetical protein